MRTKDLNRPTTFLVKFWNKDGSKCVKEQAYPMYKFSLEDVMSELKGKESECDIYESRYHKESNRYVTNGRTIIWDDFQWIVQM